MTSPPFSLLLPVYGKDHPDHLKLAFRSCVHQQTRRPDEVVLVKDGPLPPELDHTVQRLADAAPVPVRIIEIESNVGLARALERGLAACQHEIVARMDADDVSLPHRFERQLDAMEGGLDLVGSGMLEFEDDTKYVIGKRVPPVGGGTIARYARFHDPFSHPTVVYRKAAVRNAGGYQELGLMEDYWLFARMIASGAAVDNLPEPLVMYRVGAGAYDRRGGRSQFAAEIRLQRELRRLGFTTRLQFLRNVTIRGLYRFVPVQIRKRLYRALIARGLRGVR